MKKKRFTALALSAVLAVTGIFGAGIKGSAADMCGGLEEKDVYTPDPDEVIQEPALHWAIRAGLNAVQARPKLTKELVGSVQYINYEQLAHPEDFATWEEKYWIESLEGLQYATSAVMIDIAYIDNVEGKSIKDLSPISGLKQLQKLILGSDGISDISALSGLTGLKELDLSANKKITDISALSGLTKLQKLGLASNSITDLSAIENLTDLKYLSVTDNKLTTLPNFENLTNLESFEAASNQLTDISNLSAAKNLTALDLLGNTGITDYRPLASLLNLDETKTFLPDKKAKEDLFAAIAVNKILNTFNISKMVDSDLENVAKALASYEALTDEQKTYIDSGRIDAAKSNKELVEQGMSPKYYEEYDITGEAHPVWDRLEIHVIDKYGKPLSGVKFIKYGKGYKEYSNPAGESDEQGILIVKHSNYDYINGDNVIAPEDDSYVAEPAEINYSVGYGRITKSIEGKEATGLEKLVIKLTPKDEYVDKTNLQNAIKEATADILEDYTYMTDSYRAYTEALQVAQDALENADATLEEVEKAEADLRNAYQGLKASPYLTNLKITVKDVNGNLFVRPFKFQMKIADTGADAFNEYTDENTSVAHIKASVGWSEGSRWVIAACEEEPYAFDPIYVTIGKDGNTVYYDTVNSQKIDAGYEIEITVNKIPHAINQAKERQPNAGILKEYVTRLDNYDESDYRSSTYQNLKNAVESAEMLIENGAELQEEYNAAGTAILEAEAGLEERANKLELKQKLELELAYSEKYYTTASYNAFKAAIEDAKNVYEDTDATQAQVDDAVRALNDAIENLESRSKQQGYQSIVISVTDQDGNPVADGVEFEISGNTDEKLQKLTTTNSMLEWTPDAGMTGTLQITLPENRDYEMLGELTLHVSERENESAKIYVIDEINGMGSTTGKASITVKVMSAPVTAPTFNYRNAEQEGMTENIISIRAVEEGNPVPKVVSQTVESGEIDTLGEIEFLKPGIYHYDVFMTKNGQERKLYTFTYNVTEVDNNLEVEYDVE